MEDGSRYIIVTGGSGGVELNSTEVLNLDDTQQGWVRGPDLPTTLYLGASVPFGDTFLIVGGRDKIVHSMEMDTIFQFDGESFNWIQREEKLVMPRYGFAAFLVPQQVARCS